MRMLKSFVNLVWDSENTFYHIFKRKLNYGLSRWCYFSFPSGLCYRADRELWLSQGVHPHCDPLPLRASRGGQAEEEDMRPPPCVPQRRGDQSTNSCAGSAVTHTDAGPQEAVLCLSRIHIYASSSFTVET